jgi:hypothetical protein
MLTKLTQETESWTRAIYAGAGLPDWARKPYITEAIELRRADGAILRAVIKATPTGRVVQATVGRRGEGAPPISQGWFRRALRDVFPGLKWVQLKRARLTAISMLAAEGA